MTAKKTAPKKTAPKKTAATKRPARSTVAERRASAYLTDEQYRTQRQDRLDRIEEARLANRKALAAELRTAAEGQS